MVMLRLIRHRLSFFSILTLIVVLDWVVSAAAADEQLFEKEGVRLLFQNDSESLPLETQKRLVETFFEVYPSLVKTFNRNAPREVKIHIDPEFKGIAAAGGGKITINDQWMIDRPEDIDVVTHESMHVVQQYPQNAGPGWVTEGIADYARFRFGVNNDKGGWALPAYREGQAYTDSYRVTARFFVWIERKVNKGLVEKLDDVMRRGEYSEDFWVRQTDQTIDQLWASYAQSPGLDE